MIRLFTVFISVVVLAACNTQKEPPRQVPIAKANVLPLSLTDEFKISKVSTFFNDPKSAVAQRPTQNPMIAFERQRVNFGAVSSYDRVERYGNYYTVWWNAKRETDLTLRLEYRQENLGSHIQAKELFYPKAKGTYVSKFTVIGDEYTEDGKVTAWRLLLIENGRVVGLKQSFLWN
jgi:hypothetical protein